MIEPNDLRDQIGYLLTGPVLEVCELRSGLRERDAEIGRLRAEIDGLRAEIGRLHATHASQPPLHVVQADERA